MTTTIEMNGKDCVDEPPIEERLLRALEPELVESGVDPETVELREVSWGHYSYSDVEITMMPR